MNVERLPSLNVDVSQRGSPASSKDDFGVAGKRVRFDDGNNTASYAFFINSVNDENDKRRGPQLLRDIYMRLDNVSADDLLVEKSMLVKWLITRYNKKNNIAMFSRQPRDLMFAIIECVCTGMEIYLSTRQGDCRYIDRIEIFDGNIFCSCNEWMLGFIGENNSIESTSNIDDIDKPREKDTKDLDKINIFESNIERNASMENFVDYLTWNPTTDDGGLPPLLQFYSDNEENDVTNTSATTSLILEKRLELARDAELQKIRTDADKLKEYINLNVNVLAANQSSSDQVHASRGTLDDRQNSYVRSTVHENVFKLIVDTRELERLLTFLLYIDREALYGDIDVTFRNKLGTSRPFCFFRNSSKLSKDVEENCLGNSDSNRLKDIYENITNGDKHHNNNNTQEDISEKDNTVTGRALEVFEYATFLFLDKISTSIVESLISNSSSSSEKNANLRAFKFGLIDLMYPKIGKIGCQKFHADTVVQNATINNGTFKRRTVISFGEEQ